jgi:hypothetical protein
MNTRRAIDLRPLASIISEKRETQWLLHEIIESNVLALLVGPRGTFKSFIALDWSMHVARLGKPVLILSGEGAGLGMRAEAWIKAHEPGLEPTDLPIFVQERPLHLSVPEELDALSIAIAKLESSPGLIVLDTWSKFAGKLDENSNSDVASHLSDLSTSLRERFNATILIVAHTGHSDSGRARGASALTANTDAEYVVQRGKRDMRVSVSRERFKDTPSLPPLGYEARVMDLGRMDICDEPVTSLALFSTEATPMSPSTFRKQAGKHQQSAVAALREWTRVNPGAAEITTAAVSQLLNTLGMDRRRKSDVLNSLRKANFLVEADNGFKINQEGL